MHHVEAVIVEFNPQQVSYESLCKLFFEIHDPAQADGVGPDLGPQYRSCIFYRNESQKQTAEHVTELLRSKGDESIPCSCQRRHSTFYIGEAYHQHYYEKTGFKKYEVLAAKFKLIIHCCQFCRIFSQNWQKLFTPNLQTGLARNLLLHRVKAEAERARGTTRTLSNDS